MAINQRKRFGARLALRKLNTQNVVKSCLRILWEFCSFTSLHGMRYLVSDIRYLQKSSTQKRFSRKQRIAAVILSSITWGGAFIVGAAFAFTMISLIWHRFQATPTITTVDTYHYPIWNVPFPAVTICNLNKVYRPATKNIESKLLAYGANKTNIDHFFGNLSGFVRQPVYHPPTEEMLSLFALLEKEGYTAERLLMELMQPCSEMITYCIWQNQEYPCDELFRVSKGSDGFCCSFNYHPLAADGQRYSRVSGAGEYIGLGVLLKPEAEHYVSYSHFLHGFSLSIHHPTEFALMLTDPLILQPGYYIRALITSSVLETDESVRSMPRKQRNCLFPDEHTSLIQHQYLQGSCMARCRLYGMIDRCGCIPFYYPTINATANAKYRKCSMRDIPCLHNVNSVITSIRPPTGTPGFDGLNDTGLDCNCMPGCFEQRYYTTITTANRDRAPTQDQHLEQNLTIQQMKNYTALRVSFRETTCIKYRRSLYMTWDGFIASFGGIFGLCLGGSIVSLVEIVYFCVVRIGGRFIMPKTPKCKRRVIRNNRIGKV